MVQSLVTTVTTISLFTFGQISGYSEEKVLAMHEISLESRQPDRWVNGVFKDNILLNLAYLRGIVRFKEDLNWDEVKKSFTYEFKLNPGEAFAFHQDVLPEYSDRVVRTTGAHFSGAEGFKSDGYLMGDGVCHLASLMYWVARDAGLEANAPTNHDFMAIPEISREYGVSIYYYPGRTMANAKQNLYITNNKENPVIFRFGYQEDKLKLSVIKN